MELFSEIYSIYYKTISKIINSCIDKNLNQKDVEKIIGENAFSESHLYILPKLENKEWNFIEINGGIYKTILNNKVVPVMSTLEKSWLMTILYDDKIRLFLNEKEVNLLILNLKESGISPIFNKKDYKIFDQHLHGDNYSDEKYIEHFKIIKQAIKNKEILNLTLIGKNGKEYVNEFAPLQFLYSKKNDKFRVYSKKIINGKINKVFLINMSNIKSITKSKISIENLHESSSYFNKKNIEPVILEISKERNALERTMLQFACYEKRTEYLEEQDKYICYIYYTKNDETELLIQILSFGSTVKVLGHADFLEQVKKRVARQNLLLKN